MECIRKFQNSIDENIPFLNATHVTEEEIDEYRSCLSGVSFRNRLPVTVYLSVVAVVGFIGNALVMIVYWQSFKPNASRIFVLAMAIEDMTTSVIGLPLQIITIRYAYDTYSYWLCRGMFAAATFPTQTSGLILVAVALDRFHRIWWPQKKHITEHQCCVINIVIFFFAHMLFACFVPMYGIHSYPSHIEGVSVKMCWHDEYHGTPYFKAYTYVVNGMVFGGLVLMTTSYLLIGINVWKRKTPMISKSSLTATSFQSCSTDYSVHSKHAGEASVTDAPQENRESMSTRGSADVQAASGSAHNITVVEVSTVPYPLKSAMSTTNASWREKRVSYDEVHHPELTPNLRSKGPSPPSNVPNQPSYHPNQPLNDPNLPLNDQNQSWNYPSVPSNDLNQHSKDPNLPSEDEKPHLTGSSPPKDPNPQQNVLNLYSNDPSLLSEDPGASPLTRNLFKTERSHSLKIVEKDTGQESSHASGNLRDEEKIILNFKDKEDGGTSLRIRPVETKLADDHNQSLKLIVVSHANTTEESCIELGSFTENDDRLVRNYYLNNVCSASAPQLPLAISQSNANTKPVSLHTRKIRSRTTLMMAVLTFFYIVNWLPHNVSRLVSKNPINWCPGYTDCGANINALGLRSYYLNSAINAFVYSFCSTRFRHELGRMLRRLYRRFSRTL